MKMIALLALAVFLHQNGCFSDPPPKTHSENRPQASRECAVNRRFTTANTMVRGDVAFDTCSGQLCRTWDWFNSNKHIENGYGSLPLCSVLAANPVP
jgi:hypothetical protein